jgi:hypothetical protein
MHNLTHVFFIHQAQQKYILLIIGGKGGIQMQITTETTVSLCLTHF